MGPFFCHGGEHGARDRTLLRSSSIAACVRSVLALHEEVRNLVPVVRATRRASKRHRSPHCHRVRSRAGFGESAENRADEADRRGRWASCRPPVITPRTKPTARMAVRPTRRGGSWAMDCHSDGRDKRSQPPIWQPKRPLEGCVHRRGSPGTAGLGSRIQHLESAARISDSELNGENLAVERSRRDIRSSLFEELPAPATSAIGRDR